MRTRILACFIILLVFLFKAQSFAQGAGEVGENALAIPVIECRIEVSEDELFFQNYDYVPNRITVTITVENISPEDTAVARDLEVNLLADPRFNIGEGKNPRQTVINPATGGDSLMFGESASVTFELILADAADVDQTLTLGVLATSSNAYSDEAETEVWVQREHIPVYATFCTPEFDEIVFDDNINDYSPNPFTIKVDVGNNGLPEGYSDSTWVSFIGTRGVSPFPQDTPEKYLELLSPGETESVFFQLVPSRRNNDTTVTLCFQVRGIGGYKRKIYIDTCCVDIFIPAAKQAEYEVVCDIVPDSVIFIDHEYNPDPFDFNVNIRNIGTAVGKDVRAKVILPAGIQLALGEVDDKPIGDLDPNGTANVSWSLSPTRLFERETLTIGVRVYDVFNNQAFCADSVIIDSVRKAIFNVACTGPDTIFADSDAGLYLNSPFDVFFTVDNVGSDYADSVKATVIIQAPNIVPVPGFPAVQFKDLVSPDGTDTLGVSSSFVFTWPMQAEPIAIGRTVRIVFRVEALNAEPVECVLEIYVQKLDAPSLDIWCEIVPPDSVRFDPRTGGYSPPNVFYRVCAVNDGGGVARNVQATLSIPPRMLLADGETLIKNFPRDLSPNDTVCLEWVLIPVKRTDFGSDVQFTTEVTSENVPDRPTTTCTVFIPALPNTAALSISRNNVGYTGQIIMVPVFIDDPTDKDIKKFEIEIDYNLDPNRNRMPEDVVEFVEIVKVNSLTAEWDIVSQSSNPTNDRLFFTIESGTPLAYPVIPTGGVIPPLVWLKFRAVYGLAPNELSITSTDLLWPAVEEVEAKIRINDGSIFPRVEDGLIWVSGDCLRPLTASPDYSIFNKPNPFNPVTTIVYTIPTDQQVRISVFDVLGRELEVLVDEYRLAGTHAVVFNSRQLPSGIYFYRMETPNFHEMKKMVVSK
ncbi:MAG: T9SS type A sorting domain-containing protein [Bacteroidetes bacterium]|nr:T9SS type A sorting domain-containing protein [Bacteroidota bacterium]